VQRPILLVAALVVAAVGLGGCAGADELEPLQELVAPPAPVLESESFSAQVYVSAHGGCTVIVCSGGSFPSLIYTSAEDASVQAVRFDIAAIPYEDRPVEWKLTCVAEDDEDPGCLRPLGHGQEPLPAHVEAAALNLTPGTELWLEVVIPTIASPMVDSFLILVGDTDVEGAVDLALVGNASDAPDRILETVPVSFDGNSGPCYLVEPYCTGWPGGTRFPLEMIGTIVAVNLTMTWTSLSVADEILALEVGQFVGCTSCGQPRIEGPSPLVLDQGGLELEDPYTDVMVAHGDPTGLDPLGYTFEYTGTRTPVHVEGTVTFELDPDEPEDEESDG
jgi:hypothetical protein